MNLRLEAGDVVMTQWDDSVKLIRAEILRVYRGHRLRMYTVRLPDGSTESIPRNQIVRKVVRRG